MKKSFKERIAQAGCAADAKCMEGETVSCFFQGVGMVTGRQYPAWLLQRLRKSYEMPDNYPYDRLVSYAEELSREDETEQEGYGLLYQLLIELFYFMDEEEV